MRICSFLPSATEIVYCLGLNSSLYGVSHECDYPTEALSKPKLVKNKINVPSWGSKAIDDQLSEMYARGERPYEIDLEVLIQAKPDLVITQGLCDVCAIAIEDVEAALVHLNSPTSVDFTQPTQLGRYLSRYRKDRSVHR